MNSIKQFNQMLLGKLTRMEALEENLGLQINNLSFVTEPETRGFCVNFEVISLSGSSIKNVDCRCIEFKIAFYDLNGIIIYVDHSYLFPAHFKGFDIVNLYCDINIKPEEISRIVLFPQTK